MHLKTVFLRCVLLCFSLSLIAQIQVKDSITRLDNVMLTGLRIGIPLAKATHALTVITKEEIAQSGVQQLEQLLRTIAGVDVRRRGAEGTQADLYLRGGSFDQTLLLIDGFKLDDVQTGHHTLNFTLPITAIQRIEIIKGPTARVYGANAFTGAINIITKNSFEQQKQLQLRYGSFNQLWSQLAGGTGTTEKNLWGVVSWGQSKGYRYNTDFNTLKTFFKGKTQIRNLPITAIALWNNRAFGANGFYASPEAKDQYEETQAGLLGIQTLWQNARWTVRPKLYWRRGQDMYLYLRKQPEVYRNMHISNKIVAALDASTQTSWGQSGIGIEAATVALRSNNLGQRKRQQITLFLEHKFWFWEQRLSLTPGIALNYFSDFKTHAFPGMDIGWYWNSSFSLFGNLGYTYRVPTYTDLFYSDRTTLGNPNLDPEKALTHEIGFKYQKTSTRFGLSYFNRNAKALIDYVKENEEALWEAENIQQVLTKGLEAYVAFTLLKTHHMDLQYTYISDSLAASDFSFSRYTINSLKHHFTTSYLLPLSSSWQLNFSYRYGERDTGAIFNVMDFSSVIEKGGWKINLQVNNLFSAKYYETQLIPMPLANATLGLRRSF